MGTRGPLFRWSSDPDIARFNGAFRPADWISHRNFRENVGRLGILIGDESNRGRGYGRDALALATFRPAHRKQAKARAEAPGTKRGMTAVDC